MVNWPEPGRENENEEAKENEKGGLGGRKELAAHRGERAGGGPDLAPLLRGRSRWLLHRGFGGAFGLKVATDTADVKETHIQHHREEQH